MSPALLNPSHRDVQNLAAMAVRPNPNSVDLVDAGAECGDGAGFFAASPTRRSAISSVSQGVVSLTRTLLPVGPGGLPPFAALTTRLPVKPRVPTPLATPSRLHTHGDKGLHWRTLFLTFAAPDRFTLQVE